MYPTDHQLLLLMSWAGNWEFVFCIFCSYILIIYGGCLVVRNALMSVRSRNYRAAPYLNSFAIIPVRWLAWCRVAARW